MGCYTLLVAKSKDTEGLEIVEVEHPEEDADAKFLKEQNEALLHYRLTGEAGVYIDPTRDQEPDIAPELGVAPHPELANPAPPSSSFSGRALDEGKVPMVKSAAEKEEDGAEAVEAYNEYLQKRDELFEATSNTVVTPAAQPVFIVDAPESEGLVGPEIVQDGSQKNSVNSASADAQLPNASGFGTDASGPDEKKSEKSDSDKS